MSEMIKGTPVVFAIGKEYKIFVPVKAPSVMWIRVGNECYYDNANGVLRSAVTMHKITVPMEELDQEKKYTVCYRKMIERKPYFSVTGEVTEEIFDFIPLPDNSFNIYHISDAHGMVDAPVASARTFEKKYGDIDLLILNGDIIDHSGAIENFDAIYKIASLITEGSRPVIFSRGNHDTRGIYAENIVDYTPTRDGYSYFSFRIGSLWGLVLDCGEDKADSHEEYGNTNCCHAFRVGETRYLEGIIKNAESEYMEKGVSHRIIIAHSPFTKHFSPPFNIEEDIYSHWTGLISNNIDPEVMICGHTHKLNIGRPGDETDAYGESFPVTVAAQPNIKEGYFIGGGFIFSEDGISLAFCDGEKVISEQKIR